MMMLMMIIIIINVLFYDILNTQKTNLEKKLP